MEMDPLRSPQCCLPFGTNLHHFSHLALPMISLDLFQNLKLPHHHEPQSYLLPSAKS